MKKGLPYLLRGLSQRFSPDELPEQGQASQINYQELVTRAREEWQAARALFECVSDPDLVDHAIVMITATEKRYTYLLRQAKMDSAGGELY